MTALRCERRRKKGKEDAVVGNADNAGPQYLVPGFDAAPGRCLSQPEHLNFLVDGSGFAAGKYVLNLTVWAIF